MGFLGVILFLLILWIIVLIVMAIFATLCIIFSALSAAKAKQFLASNQYPDYKKAKGRFIAALVFFILTCLTSVGGLGSLEVLLDGTTTMEELFNPIYLIFFVVPPALLIVAVVLGIRCFIWYGRADKLNKQLMAAAAAPFMQSQSQPFPAPVQSFSVCPACGTANDSRNRFCVKCGQIIR